jgi:polyphosphate kinase
MSRNLDHRSEVGVPIYDKHLKEELRDFLKIQFSDNTKARMLDEKLSNKYVSSTNLLKSRSQVEFYKYLQKKLI